MAKAGPRVEAGMVEGANCLLDFSLQEVPRDTNVLAESASITQEGSGVNTKLYVGYGMYGRPGVVIRGPGNDFVKKAWSDAQGRLVVRIPANYAWVQHFNMKFHHIKGKSHYLTDPTRNRIVEIRSAFRRGFRGTP